MVFVGPSGCGKTTALRMVAGLEEITAGEIAIGDETVNELDPRRRDVAMVFQNYALYPHMTVFENIAFGLRARRAPKSEIRRRVESAGQALGLADLLQRKPRQLSGGQRQRVAMGRAIVREPRVFLMDEPLSNLDARLRVQMRAEVARVQRELGVTTIYVTHDQVEAMTMGDRVAVMRGGVLQQTGDPQVVFDRPANLFVASFIGSPPMNLVRRSSPRAAAVSPSRSASRSCRSPPRRSRSVPGCGRTPGARSASESGRSTCARRTATAVCASAAPSARRRRSAPSSSSTSRSRPSRCSPRRCARSPATSMPRRSSGSSRRRWSGARC